MIFDKNSPRIKDILIKSKRSIAIEIFPNLIVNINSAKKFAKQIHYLISRDINGIIHHGSNDLVNHDEYIFSSCKLKRMGSFLFGLVANNKKAYM